MPSISTGSWRLVQDPITGEVVWKRRKHQNPLNVHALRRAIRRMRSFRKIAHRVEMSFPMRHAPRSRHFPFTRSRRRK